VQTTHDAAGPFSLVEDDSKVGAFRVIPRGGRAAERRKRPVLWASVLSTAAQHIAHAHAIITARKD
jgi:hypothetical protein